MSSKAEIAPVVEKENPIREVNRSLFKRRMQTNRKLMKWGFGIAAAGLVVATAAAIATPVAIPFALASAKTLNALYFVDASTKALYLASATGTAAFGGGTGVGLFGALKNIVDKHRRM
jgi:hypothetical protein